MVDDLEPSLLGLLDHGAAELRDGDLVVGHLTSQLESGWGLGRPFGRQVFVWLLVTMTDGSRQIIEDYPPYVTVPDAVRGELLVEELHPRPLSVHWLGDERRQVVWGRFGIHESPGYYLFENAEPIRWPWSSIAKRFRRAPR